MLRHRVPFVLASAVLACVPLGAAEDYVLVRDGVATCAIVVPSDGTPPQEYGANDLSKHLHLMSGATVPVYKQTADSDLPPGYEGLILLTSQPLAGEPPLENEECRVTTQPGTPWVIRICGDSRRGALYGCYALLQDVLGCRWFTRTIARIPQQSTVTVGTLNLRQRPSFEYREPFYWEALTNTEWIVRNRVNGANCQVDDSVGGKVRYGTFVHTLFTLVPPDTYFASHPEYFALVKGQRLRHTQLCLTNPEVLRIAVAGVREWIAKNPSADIFSVSQMDNEGGACQCADCTRVKDEEGAESGPILRFVNAVAAEIGKDHPRVLLDTLAYNYSQKPPTLVRPLPNVRIRLCLPWSCKAHVLESACSKDAYQDLYAWSQITQQLYVWDYNTEFNDYMLLHPSLHYTKTVFGTFKRTGVVGNFMQGSYQSPGGCLAEMKSYLCAQLMWDHTRDADAILSAYIAGVYGKAAPLVAEWIALIHSPFKQDTGVKMLGIYDLPSAAYLTREVLEGSDELLERASAATAADPVALDEVGKIRMWVDYTRLAQIRLQGEVQDGKYGYGVSAKDLDRVDRWLASLKHYNVTHFAEGVPSAVTDVLTRQNASVDCTSLENADLRVDVLPTLGGKIARLLDKHRGVDLMLPPKSVFHKIEGGDETYVTEAPRGAEFWGVNYTVTVNGSAVTLQGVSPAGREITRQFTLAGRRLTLRTAVRNTTSQPLPVTIWDRPQFPLRDFGDVRITFDQVGGGAVALAAKDFSINWTELSKTYRDRDLPAGKVVFRLGQATLTSQFNPQDVERLHIFNNGGITEMISLEVYGKSVTLAPGETTAREQSWTIE